jgi:hypothetical protein
MSILADRLKEVISPSLDSLLRLSVFSDTSKLLPLATEVQILREYERYTSVYPICVASALSAIPSEATRIPLVKNLWEEHGEGDARRGHRYLMHCWVESVSALLGDQRESSHTPSDSTIKACNMLTSISEENGLFRFGLVLGLEYTNISQLESLLARLPASSKGKIDSRYINLHLEADGDHVEELIEAAAGLIKGGSNMGHVLRGVQRSTLADTCFWRGIDAWANSE